MKGLGVQGSGFRVLQFSNIRKRSALVFCKLEKASFFETGGIMASVQPKFHNSSKILKPQNSKTWTSGNLELLGHEY